MRWAIALALEGSGTTSPNPMVGAVIVKAGKIVGEGFHRRAGLPHAEVDAINNAGKLAKGATLYVTLEPCTHTGRTPPCVEAIIKAGIKRVYVGTRDPNPIVRGKGIRILRHAGIEVFENILEERCRTINDSYNKFITTSLPYVTLKAALSIDGKIATSTGDSKWITNEECRKFVHRLRAQTDAIIIGLGTAVKDDPLLDVRLTGLGCPSPKAIIVTEDMKPLKKLKLFRRKHGELIIAVNSRIPKKQLAEIKLTGHTVITCKTNKNGLVDLKDLLKKIGQMGITSVMVEGGGRIFSDFYRHKLIDKIYVCIAPKIIGGEGRDFLPRIKIKDMTHVPQLKITEIKKIGDNIVIEGRL